MVHMMSPMCATRVLPHGITYVTELDAPQVWLGSGLVYGESLVQQQLEAFRSPNLVLAVSFALLEAKLHVLARIASFFAPASTHLHRVLVATRR